MAYRRPPWWLYIVAASFLVLYAFVPYGWLYGPTDPAGLSVRFSGEATELLAVEPGSQADLAGLRAGDLVLSVDLHPVRNTHDWNEVKANMEVGKPQTFEVSRDGQRLNIEMIPRVLLPEDSLFVSIFLYNIAIALCYLVVGLFIAFRRPFDPVAMVGAWFIVTASVAFGLPNGWAVVWRHLPFILQGLLWIPQLSRFVIEGIFLSFVVLFPRRIFRSRWPWAVIWAPVLATLPWRVFGMYAVIYRPGMGLSNPSWLFEVTFPRTAIYLLTGVLLLAVNYARLEDLNEKRRIRVLVAGIMVSLVSAVGILWVIQTRGFYLGPGYPLMWIFLPFTLACPLAFAYAILRHRALDVQLIVRQGLQYALARGAILGLVPVLVVLLVADLAINSQQPLVDILQARGWVYAGLAAAAVLVYFRRRKWLETLDRRFFRERYNAQRVLREVVQQSRLAGSLDEVAPHVVAKIEAALHPEFAALLVRESGQQSFRSLASVPAGQAVPPLDAESKLMALLRVLGKPLEVLLTGSDWLQYGLPPEDTDFIRKAKIDLLVPVTSGTERREALLALGIKRSEEPYTREDRELLEAVAASLALLIEQGGAEPQRVEPMMEECPRCGTCYDSGAVNCSGEGAALVPVGFPRLLVGRYRLNRRVGGGGMGTVYEAIDSSLERSVAVKVMRDELAGNSVAAERFRFEARAVASFSHPNVVTVHDFGVEAGSRAFLVMELLEGVSLRKELRALGRLDPARTLRISSAVCSAVDAAHRRQLVHRDLKPENIFLVRSPAGGTPSDEVKVLDFGVAKSISPPQQNVATHAATADTGPGILVGTVAYMSPEQLSGEAASVSWDLWAVSVVAYEMLTGALPFAQTTGGNWVQSVLTGSFTPVQQYLPQAPVCWQQFFARALAVSVRNRPSSARELLRQLEEALSSR